MWVKSRRRFFALVLLFCFVGSLFCQEFVMIPVNDLQKWKTELLSLKASLKRKQDESEALSQSLQNQSAQLQSWQLKAEELQSKIDNMLKDSEAWESDIKKIRDELMALSKELTIISEKLKRRTKAMSVGIVLSFFAGFFVGVKIKDWIE